MRFYVSPESIFIEKNLIEIKDRAQIHHIRDVMRLKKGTIVDIFDGRGREYRGKITEISRSLVLIEINNALDFKRDILYKITLYQALPKKSKMDFIIEKSVELGVTKVVPIVTERTEARVSKPERWNRIAKSASEQCGRIDLPVIEDIKDFSNALTESNKNDLVIFAALDKDVVPLKGILRSSTSKTIGVFVGPEGDFTHAEINKAREQGFRISSLGPLVLRVETAALYILSCLNYEYSEANL